MGSLLAKHLRAIGAEGIRKDPQAHIDALVEAGVLEEVPLWQETDDPRVCYAVVQPHVHVWRVGGEISTLDPKLWVQCDCGESRHVPNRLPIEAPND